MTASYASAAPADAFAGACQPTENKTFISDLRLPEKFRRIPDASPIRTASVLLVLVTAVVDCWASHYVSLRGLLLLPMIPAALWLWIARLIYSQRSVREAEQRFRRMVESSAAAIVTLDESGFVVLASRAAVRLLSPTGAELAGAPIAAFLPEVHEIVRDGKSARSAASFGCRGYRNAGESFHAEICFSECGSGRSRRFLAVIRESAIGPGDNRDVLVSRPALSESFSSTRHFRPATRRTASLERGSARIAGVAA